MEHKIKKMKCPVCGKYEFPMEHGNEMCEVCGWLNDEVQLEDPDLTGGDNRMSLNQARAAYARGEEVM